MNSLLFHVTNFMKINHKNAKKILNCMKLIFECMKCHSRCKNYRIFSLSYSLSFLYCIFVKRLIELWKRN